MIFQWNTSYDTGLQEMFKKSKDKVIPVLIYYA